MTVYVHVTLKVKAAGVTDFVATMKKAVPILEAHGWRLVLALAQRTGRLNTVIDIWELEDFDHFDRGLKGLTADPRFPEIKAVLDANVQSETIVFADRLNYV